MIEGTLSTRPLASFKPRPVISRTALIALTFGHRIQLIQYRMNFSSGASPPAAPATATGAEAETSNSSSIALTKSFKSEIEASFNESIIASLSKPFFVPPFYMNLY